MTIIKTHLYLTKSPGNVLNKRVHSFFYSNWKLSSECRWHGYEPKANEEEKKKQQQKFNEYGLNAFLCYQEIFFVKCWGCLKSLHNRCSRKNAIALKYKYERKVFLINLHSLFPVSPSLSFFLSFSHSLPLSSLMWVHVCEYLPMWWVRVAVIEYLSTLLIGLMFLLFI